MSLEAGRLRSTRWVRAAAFLVLVAACGVMAAPVLGQTPCHVPDNGGGTINLPPQGCGYVSPADLHRMIIGLPPGSTIEVAAEHSDFFNINRQPGGSLGGEKENFQSVLILNMRGTGMLSGFNRLLNIQIATEVHTGPRTAGASTQSFANDMFKLQGQIVGDPDFDLLKIKAGSAFGMPSPGHTTLTRLPGGDWAVDSFFDIFYEIEFIGHPGGPLGGHSGSTTGTIRMQAGQPAPPVCTVPDNGSGTVNLPPPNCGYVSPDDLHKIIDGLPAGTEIEVGAQHRDFFNVQTFPDGSGGEIEQFGSGLLLKMRGTGMLAGFNRTLSLQTQVQVHTNARTGSPVQTFDTEMLMVQGQLPAGDPDFDLLTIKGGSAFGMPSPGHTTLTKVPGTPNWNVDSFFDIEYQIDFVGHPGGRLGGMSGSTTATIRMQTGQPPPGPPPCTVVDNGGTANLPPQGCGYVSPSDLHKMINGLPPGTVITVEAQHDRFFQVNRTPGGLLGGEIEQFGSNLQLHLKSPPNYDRRIVFPTVQCQTHVGPRTPGNPIQSFDTLMNGLSGQLPPGDPDFDLLKITAGNGFGMPSPGHTTLTLQQNGLWNVDSFFDVFYKIEFAGHTPGPFGGMSGSTTGTIRMQAYQELVAPTGVPKLTLPGGGILQWLSVPNASGYDIVYGNLQALHSSAGNYVVSTIQCLANDTPSNAVTHALIPPIDGGFWYVVRPENVAGNGTYDSGGVGQQGSRDAEIQGSGLGCP